MGGLIAQMIFAQDKRFASLVSVIGRSSFFQTDEWCRQAQTGTWCDQWCAEHATQSRPERYVDRPILFMNGGVDTDGPAAVDAETVRLINERGGQAVQIVDDAVGHEFSPMMRKRYLEWIIEHKG